MALRPAVQALKDFGPLDYEPETDERWDFFHALFFSQIEPLLSTFTDAEAEVLVQALGPSGHDFYGTKYVILDWLELTPAWPESMLSMDFLYDTLWRDIVLHRARSMLWRTKYRYRAALLYACEGLEVCLRFDGLHLNTEKSTRLSTGAFPWIKTFPAGLS